MISITQSGDFRNTEKFIKSMMDSDMFKSLDGLARVGVDALASATPSDTGLTAASWDYEITITRDHCTISWLNRNTLNGFNVAIGLQYGHGTGTGGWVSGQDYINPAIRPVFDKIADDVWKVVTNA